MDYGFVGDIDKVDTTVLTTQLENGLLPVVSPLSADASGTLLNINADTVAAALASALGAAKLVLATGAPGILEDRNDPASLISYVDLSGLEKLEQAVALADGMLPKARAIEQAIRGGVPRVHVISYKVPDTCCWRSSPTKARARWWWRTSTCCRRKSSRLPCGRTA